MSLIKTMYIDKFYLDVENVAGAVAGLNFTKNKFGAEIENFNMVDPRLIDRFREMLHDDKLEIVDEKSGIFRQPHVFIHFEDFWSPLDWCFTVALQQTTFNLFKHESGAESALDNPTLNSINFIEWDTTASIILQPNQCVFFRPWLYHSFLGGITQHYIIKHVFDEKELE